MKTLSVETMQVLLNALQENRITQDRFEIIVKLLIDSLI